MSAEGTITKQALQKNICACSYNFTTTATTYSSSDNGDDDNGNHCGMLMLISVSKRGKEIQCKLLNYAPTTTALVVCVLKPFFKLIKKCVS